MSKRPSDVRDEGPQGKVARTDDVVAGVVKKSGTWSIPVFMPLIMMMRLILL